MRRIFVRFASSPLSSSKTPTAVGRTVRLRILSTILAALTAMAASQAGTAATLPELTYSIKTVERHDSACPLSGSDTSGCSHILFKYPVIERAPTNALAAAVNQAVSQFLTTPMSAGARQYASVAAAIDAFRPEYGGWRRLAFWEDRIVIIVYQSPAFVSLRFAWASYRGGEHANSAVLFTSFNAKTGTAITLTDVLVPGYRSRLTRIAEQEFRALKGIAPGTPLRDAGYTFKNDTFALNDNFWLGAKGVTFFYNDYEIAPYGKGATEVFVPYAEIRGLIKPDGLLASMR